MQVPKFFTSYCRYLISNTKNNNYIYEIYILLLVIKKQRYCFSTYYKKMFELKMSTEIQKMIDILKLLGFSFINIKNYFVRIIKFSISRSAHLRMFVFKQTYTSTQIQIQILQRLVYDKPLHLAAKNRSTDYSWKNTTHSAWNCSVSIAGIYYLISLMPI